MTFSMTAFSRKEIQSDQGELVCEIRSVNHRYLEASVRLPEELRSLEHLVRERLNKRLGRGKVDCTLRFSPSASSAAAVRVNSRLAQQIIDAADEVSLLLHESVPPKAMDIMRWPGVLEAEEVDLAPIHKQAIELLEEGIGGLLDSRRREGERLAELIAQRVTAMREEVIKVRELMPRVLESVRNRLKARLAEVSENLDVERLEQEMALLAQRLDVDEEMDR
ncbi:MAG: YicC/YloC family endoribonuclease, partial [Candidatus Sedimenticola sp. (ex Thyasira tokunagai)]